MAQYTYDFASETVGQAPTGLTVRHGTAVTHLIQNDGTQNYWFLDTGNDAGIGWTAIDSDADRATVQVLFQASCVSLASGSSPHIGVLVRANIDRDGYYMGPAATITLNVCKVVDGVESNPISGGGGTIAITAGQKFWVRGEVTGTTVRCKTWDDGDTEPGAWTVELTDADISAAGFVGIYHNSAATDSSIYYLSVGTNGDSAPAPSGATAVTLSGPASGITNQASSNFTVGANGAISGTVTVTPASTLAGTFTPTTVQISAAAPTATFTFTPTVDGAHSITLTNDGGLTNPSAHAYSAAASSTLTIANQPTRFYNAASGSVTIPVSGTCSLEGVTIRVRAQDASGATNQTAFAVVGTVSGGAWSGTVTVDRRAEMSVFVAEIQSDPGTTATQTESWAAGLIGVLLGDLQAANLFTLGTGTFNAEASGKAFIFDGTFNAATATGEGKVALFNWLSVFGGCPTCLITDTGTNSITRWHDGTSTTVNYDALTALADQIGGGISGAIIWVGDTDANAALSRANFLTRINGVMAQLRSDYGATLPIGIMGLGTSNVAGGTDTSWNDIRGALVSLPTLPYNGAGPNNIVMPTWDLAQSDQHQFTSAGLAIGAARAAHGMLRQYSYGGASFAYPPRVTAATYSGAVTTTTIEHDGGNDITPAGSYTGIEFFDDGVAVSIISSTRTAGNKISHTLAAAPSGVLTMRVGDGKFPDSSAVPRDNSARTLPLQTTDGAITVTQATSVTFTPGLQRNGGRSAHADGTAVIVEVTSMTVAGQMVDFTATAVAGGVIPPFTSTVAAAGTPYGVTYKIGGTAIGSEVLIAS